MGLDTRSVVVFYTSFGVYYLFGPNLYSQEYVESSNSSGADTPNRGWNTEYPSPYLFLLRVRRCLALGAEYAGADFVSVSTTVLGVLHL